MNIDEIKLLQEEYLELQIEPIFACKNPECENTYTDFDL